MLSSMSSCYVLPVKPDGKLKVRLVVASTYSQKQGVDYSDISAPVASNEFCYVYFFRHKRALTVTLTSGYCIK